MGVSTHSLLGAWQKEVLIHIFKTAFMMIILAMISQKNSYSCREHSVPRKNETLNPELAVPLKVNE